MPDSINTLLDKYKYYVEWCNENKTITANKNYFDQIINNTDM